MSFTYDFEPRGHYLLVRARGVQASLEQGVAYTRAMSKACAEHELHHLLLDERELRLQTSTVADFELVMQVLLERLHINVSRIACVPHPDDFNRLKFFENAAQNRGINFCLFRTLEGATQWLEEA
jgi:hypothetical protein